MFRENLNDYLESIDLADVKKEYLTLDELKKLANTPCEIPVLKSASLFSCLTGLRISDILNLHWQDIVPASEGGYCMRIRTEKTDSETTLPIRVEQFLPPHLEKYIRDRGISPDVSAEYLTAVYYDVNGREYSA